MLVRSDWTLEELAALYEKPLLELIADAAKVHGQFHKIGEIQICHLMSIKTGGCSEDCKYCAQSSRYQTSVKPLAMMKYEEVLEEAKKAIARGATRICLGAAWREVKGNHQFDKTLAMIKGLSELNVEVCVTLGLLNEEQAQKLKEAGLYAYNHNLDSSKRFYQTIITTRSYEDRIDTLDRVEKAGISLCSGGILGMGETKDDRLEMLLTLANRSPQPESVPINRLTPIPGTPLENQPPLSTWEMIRIIAIARILMPKAMVRLSAGRIEMSFEQQALCFLSGANSIFCGEKLLTVKNSSQDSDEEMFKLLGLQKRPAYAHRSAS